jgi:hypothetical protein
LDLSPNTQRLALGQNQRESVRLHQVCFTLVNRR